MLMNKFYGRMSLIVGMVFAVAMFGITACDSGGPGGPGGPGTPGTPPEELSDAERWGSWAEPGSGVTITRSVANDGVVTVNVGGTATTDDLRWKADVGLSYTVQKNAIYEYVFEAWTAPGSGNRTLNVQYYGGGDTDTAGPPYLGTPQEITETKTTYTIIGTIVGYGGHATKNGVTPLQFQCANQLGTFYVRILSITKKSGTSGDLMYIEDPSSITIAGYTGSGSAVVIPPSINNKPVVAIIGWLFSLAFIDMTSVTIGANVTIDYWAFMDFSHDDGEYTYYTDSGFVYAYDDAGKAAGTYTRDDDDNWTKQ